VRRSRGQAIVWVAVLLPVIFIPIVGLSIDAGLLFDARREAQNVADGAARAGAMELDQRVLQRDGRARIDRKEAQVRARAYAAHSGFNVRRFDFSNDDRTLAVTVGTTVQPSFMRLLKARAVDVQAEGRARLCQGTQAEGACS
jgi:Flp pilus assembly protein TadG